MSTEVTEQSILEALHKVPREKWGLVLEILHNLEPPEVALPPQGADPGCWTATQLLALPPPSVTRSSKHKPCRGR